MVIATTHPSRGARSCPALVEQRRPDTVKRILLIVSASVTAAACGMPSGLTTPTNASGTSTGTTYVAAQTCPSPSPSVLPLAVFGRPAAVQGCGGGTTPPGNVITPVFSVIPQSGTAPLTVNASMCGSHDPDPAITLHYAADYGDGGNDGGDTACQFQHIYAKPGTYSLTECVWDEIPADAPGACKTFTVTATGACSFVTTGTCDFGGGYTTIQVQTSGNGACGNPLTLYATQGTDNPIQVSQSCAPGSNSPSCVFNFPFPFSSAFPAPPTVVTGVNASGSVTVPPGPPFETGTLIGKCG
jgi:hypothetical protein